MEWIELHEEYMDECRKVGRLEAQLDHRNALIRRLLYRIEKLNEGEPDPGPSAWEVGR